MQTWLRRLVSNLRRCVCLLVLERDDVLLLLVLLLVQHSASSLHQLFPVSLPRDPALDLGAGLRRSFVPVFFIAAGSRS